MVYIPSKGRAGITLADKYLTGIGWDYTFIVEPQDYESYAQLHKKVVAMPENNMGIAYARNFCKSYSRGRGETHHWQLDDDIRRVKKFEEDMKRATVETSIPMSHLEQIMVDFPMVKIGGFVHDAFAFTKKTTLGLNKMVCTFFLVNNDTSAEWDKTVVEDTDFSLQVLHEGNCTLNLNRYAYNVPPTMTMKGGNTEIHTSGGLSERQYALAAKYPGQFKIKEVEHRAHMLPSRIWQRFTQVPNMVDITSSIV